MTPAECAAFLRRYNEWRRGDAEDNTASEMPHPREIGAAIDRAIQLIEQRDELLAALEHVVASTLSIPRFAEKQAIAAIARAKGGAA